MKKAVTIAVFLLALMCSISVLADEDAMKISLGGIVKPAKEIGTGKGITFTLPELGSNEFYIYAIELAVFEKQNGEDKWHIYKDANAAESKKQYIESPASLTFNVNFGDASDYRDKAKYKMAYRYYVQNLQDTSLITIAGSDIKDGWRLVGESDTSVSSDNGFMFYKNSAPIMEIEGFSYKIHHPEGLKTRDITDTAEVFFPLDLFENGVTVQMTASDFDTEDILTASYRLEDAVTGQVIKESALPNDSRIVTDYKTDSYRLYITVSDNYGRSVTSEAYVFAVDSEPAVVTGEFDDGGYAVMGENLFSDFTVNDGFGELMTDGTIYAEIFFNDTLFCSEYLTYIGNGMYRLDKTGMPDGEYTVRLNLYDKAGNKSEHVFYQTLDDTPPELVFVHPDDNPSATYYSEWMNESRQIIFNAADNGAGINIYRIYLSGIFVRSNSFSNAPKEKTIIQNVTNTKTGKLSYEIRVYDNAKAINKGTNRFKSSNGNGTTVYKSVWLDKTKPSITINHEDSGWKEAPYSVTANFNDYPSSESVLDASGVKTKMYAVTQNITEEPVWSVYSENVLLSEGGVYFIHFKAIDNAGNEQTETVRVRLNTKSVIVGRVRPTEEYMHTIYFSSPGFYVVKNTAYITKYHLELKDKDVGDVIKAKVRLINRDENSVFGTSKSLIDGGGNEDRNVVFSMPYLDEELRELPDGVYDMYITISEIKNDGEEIVTHRDFKDCEVVIKRNAPPTPVINTEADKVSITYPEETLAESLNNANVKAHSKYQYKAVKDSNASTNVYRNYTGEFDADDFVVTALYTDIAGNTSVASKRIYKPESDTSGKNIITEGNTVTVEESRAADVYYIGTRRDKNNGINNSIFGFLN